MTTNNNDDWKQGALLVFRGEQVDQVTINMNTMHSTRGYEVHKPDPIREYNWLKGQIEDMNQKINDLSSELAAKRTAILAEHVAILVSIGITQEELEQAIVEAKLKQ